MIRRGIGIHATVPRPEGECEGVVVEELLQDALVPVQESAVKGEEEPRVVNLKGILLARIVECIVAVEAVDLPLVVERTRVGLGERAHELVTLFDARDFFLGEEVRGAPSVVLGDLR